MDEGVQPRGVVAPDDPFDVLIDDCREVLSHADSDRVPRAAGVTQYPPAGLGEPASVHRRDDVEAAFEQSNLRIRLT